MAFQKGERYQRPDPKCGYEIEVTRSSAPGWGGGRPAAAAEKR